MKAKKVEKIGCATLYLGDAREIMQELHKPNTIITDPPYGMNFQSNHRTEKHLVIEGDDSPELMNWVCGLEVYQAKYIFGRWDNLEHIPLPDSVITWIKNNHSMGDLEHTHARQTESIFFYAGLAHLFPDRRPTDIVYADRTDNKLHPTQKPVALMKQVISWTRGTVLDPFMGSGSTGVASVEMRRDFIGIEINPDYFDIACKLIDEAQRQEVMDI